MCHVFRQTVRRYGRPRNGLLFSLYGHFVPVGRVLYVRQLSGRSRAFCAFLVSADRLRLLWYGVRIMSGFLALTMSRIQARRVWRLFSLYGVFRLYVCTCTAYAVPCVVGRFCAFYGVSWSVSMSSRARCRLSGLL